MNYETEFECHAAIVKMDEHLRGARGEDMANELIQAMAGIKTGLDSVKILREYEGEVADAHKRGEFMRIIGELSLNLAKAEITLAQQLRENEALEGRVKELQEEIGELKTPSVKLVVTGNYYYKEEDGEGPFCISCYDKSRVLARVIEQRMGSKRQKKCTQCDFTAWV